MNYSKLANIMFIIGFFILMGAVGKADQMMEIGELYPISKIIKTSLIDLLFMSFSLIRR